MRALCLKIHSVFVISLYTRMGTSQTRRAKERVSTSRNTLKLEYLSNDLSGKGKKPSLVIANIKSPLLTYLSLSLISSYLSFFRTDAKMTSPFGSSHKHLRFSE